MAGCLFLFCSPVLVGLIGVILPSVGFFPAFGEGGLSWAPARRFISTPGLSSAILLSLFTGITATILALFFSFAVLATCAENRLMRYLRRFLGPLISVPHSTIAIGMLFLLTPSGWLMRLVSPNLTGFDRPPLFAWFPDPYGMSLILGLLAKEIPFLIIVGMTTLATLPTTRLIRAGVSLGYGRAACWLFLILPLVYRHIRLPLAAVLVYGLSVVDMALLLAPTLPPPLAVLIFQTIDNSDLLTRLSVSFGACLQLALVILAILLWQMGEVIISHLFRHFRNSGYRLLIADRLLPVLASIGLLPMALAIFGFIAILLWSIAGSWFFPAAIPNYFTIQHWIRAVDMIPLLGNSVLLAFSATGLALIVVMAVCELTPRQFHHKNRLSGWLHLPLYLPLLVPQISFLFGLQILFSWQQLDGTWAALIWVHALFILPYIWLILRPAFDYCDPRFDQVAATLGKNAYYRFFHVKLPLLAYPLAISIFIGVSVSIALYVPTLLIGAGRVNTVTLEAVIRATGGSRSQAGIAAILQMLIPMIVYITLQSWLYIRFRKFSAMQDMMA